MRIFLIAALLILAGPAHAASEAGDLLKALMLDAKDPVAQFWGFDVEAAKGVSWVDDEPQWSEKRNAFARSGSVELAWPGAEGTGLAGFAWNLALIGTQAGPNQIEIDSLGNMQELSGRLPELKGVELTPRLCDEDESPMYGMKVYTADAAGK